MIIDSSKVTYVYAEPVDMRKSFDSLYSLVRNERVFDGDVFLFLSKDRKRAKALFWDGSGLNLWMKRMEYGRFADIARRGSLTIKELQEFFSGSSLIAQAKYVPKNTDEINIGLDL